MMSQMSSHRSYIGFCRLWSSIHLASSDPPRLTMPISRLLHVRQMLLEHAGVNREVIDALLRLMFAAMARIDCVVEVLELAADDHRIDRDGADRHGAVLQDRFAALVEIAAGGEVHHRVGAPALGPVQLFDFFVRSGRDRRGPHVGVDLGAARRGRWHIGSSW